MQSSVGGEARDGSGPQRPSASAYGDDICSVDTRGQRAGVKKVEGSGMHCGRITGKQAVRRQDGRSGRPRLFR